MRIIIIVAVSRLDDANTAARQLQQAGQDTFTVPLDRDDEEVAAYWASWAMTPYQLEVMQEVLETTVLTKDDEDPEWMDDGIWFFYGENGGWTPDEVLDVLGLSRWEAEI